MEPLVNFFESIKNTTTLELLAVSFGLISVLFARVNHILLFPSGLISTAIFSYMWVQHSVGLYAEGVLNLYYFIMTLYGWYNWSQRKKENHELPISQCTKNEHKIALTLSLVASLIFYLLLLQTPSTVAFWDAVVAATACTGMWLLSKRKLENWIWLNISNALSIPLFIYKSYALSALFTLVLFIIAISGYSYWKKQIIQQELSKQAH